MSINGSSPPFLLQVTLLKTSNPVVSRLLSVPPNATFEMLHKAIEAAFDWSEDETSHGASFPLFSIVQGNPFEFKSPKGMKVIVHIANDGDYVFEDGDEIWDPCLTKMDQVFDDLRFREKFVIYDYYCGFFHVVQLLGRSGYSTKGKVLCIGGQGYTTQKTWDQGRTADHADASGGLSSWELSLGKIRARVEQLGVNHSGSADRVKKERG